MTKDTPESLGFGTPAKPKKTERLTLEERQARMLNAMVSGMRNDEGIAEVVYRLFRITPNLRSNKNWRELIQYLKEAGEPVEKLEAFAKWWYKDYWIGQRGQPPTANQIRELLPQALEKYDRSQTIAGYLRWENPDE